MNFYEEDFAKRTGKSPQEAWPLIEAVLTEILQTKRGTASRDFEMARDRYRDGLTYAAIGKKHGISGSRVQQCCYWVVRRAARLVKK